MMTNPTRLVTTATAFCLYLASATAQAAIVPRLNSGQSLTISAIGTSETALSPWLGVLGDWLNGKYPGKVTLDNEAISGSESSSGINTQLPAALTHNPDAIFIEFAINDAAVGYAESVQTSKDHLQTMIDTINAYAASNKKSVDIVIQTTNNDPYSGYRPNLASYYQGYREVAAANGLLLVDHYPTWVNLYNSDPTTWNNYVSDGIHPNSLGVYNIILPEIQLALNAQVPEPGSFALLITGLIGLSVYAWQESNKS